jgi:hypothetical protein
MSLLSRPIQVVLTIPPRIVASTIEQVLLWINGDKIDMHPGYQRQPKWTHEQTSEFINTIMSNGIIPELVFYKLQPEDIKTKNTHNWECFDGQNRLSVIWHFRNGTPIKSKKNTFMIYWYIEEIKTYVFYDKTKYTEEWSMQYNDRQVEYFPTEYKNHFDNVMIDIKHIESPMSFDMRCREFRKLQNGTKVTGSDLFKTCINIPIIHYMMNERFEERFKDKFCDAFTVNHHDFFVHNLIRMYLLFIANDDKRKIILTNDKEIKQWIVKNSPKLTSVNEHFEKFKNKMEEIISFLSDYIPDVKLPPTYFYSLFAYVLVTDKIINRNVLAEFIRNWVKACPKDDRKLWQQPSTIEHLPFLLDRCILDIEDNFNTILEENIPEIEKPVSSYVRLQIWNREHANAYDNEKVNCPMGCGRMMTIRRHHCAHRIARANGGSNDPDNLISTCISCNLEMGTLSTDEWREIQTGRCD